MVNSVLLIGATGLIGTQLLNQCLVDDYIDSVVAPTRKPLERQHSKLANPLFKDIDDLDLEGFEINTLLCCFGTTRKKAGSAQAFEEIETHFMQTLLIKAKKANIKNVIFVSSLGANPNSLIHYSRVKAMIEDFALNLGFESLYILRPSLLLGHRNEDRFLEGLSIKISKKLKPLKKLALKSWPVESRVLAQVMSKF